MADEWLVDDYRIPKNWSSERKWTRIRELLAGADSVEVLDQGTHYLVRVWTRRG